MSALDRLADESYVLLTTFRKDGRAVPTPVWAARDGDTLAVWSVVDAGKVKRIRRNGAVTVAPCDLRGNPKGEATPGQAALTGSRDADERIRRLIARKYGLMGRITMFGSRIRRGRDGTVGIHITFTE